jgi:hypothetical protein
VPTIEARVRIVRNEADVDWIRLGGAKGWMPDASCGIIICQVSSTQLLGRRTKSGLLFVVKYRGGAS